MQKKHLLIAVGTRPNFVKISRFKELLENHPRLRCSVVHTGQHYDPNMSEVFFEKLGIGPPDIQLPSKKGTQIQVISRIMEEFETVLAQQKPDLVLVPGDVNSSVACALVASRNNIPVGHIESGLRSFDRTMPEEINRILIDDLADLFFITEQSGLDHLLQESKPIEKCHFVGNTMIDSIEKIMPSLYEEILPRELEERTYCVATFHRPSNVDDPSALKEVADILYEIARDTIVVFPMHPRTRNNLERFGLAGRLRHNNIRMIEPQDYITFVSLCRKALFVITDSGGIQEETTYLGVPCITLRENTERPVSVDLGTNVLCPLNTEAVMCYVKQVYEGSFKKGTIPPFWDGHATERILSVLETFFQAQA